jgi:hypothetical protein
MCVMEPLLLRIQVCIFIFDDFEELVRDLVEQGLGRRYAKDVKGKQTL